MERPAPCKFLSGHPGLMAATLAALALPTSIVRQQPAPIGSDALNRPPHGTYPLPVRSIWDVSRPTFEDNNYCSTPWEPSQPVAKFGIGTPYTQSRSAAALCPASRTMAPTERICGCLTVLPPPPRSAPCADCRDSLSSRRKAQYESNSETESAAGRSVRYAQRDAVREADSTAAPAS